MRLKVSPKAALGMIDDLIYEGFRLESEHGETLKKGMAITVSEEDRQKIMDWQGKAIKGLQDIFLDFAPVYFLWKAIDDVKVEDHKDMDTPYRVYMGPSDESCVRVLEGGLRTLGELPTMSTTN